MGAHSIVEGAVSGSCRGGLWTEQHHRGADRAAQRGDAEEDLAQCAFVENQARDGEPEPLTVVETAETFDEGVEPAVVA